MLREKSERAIDRSRANCKHVKYPSLPGVEGAQSNPRVFLCAVSLQIQCDLPEVMLFSPLKTILLY